MTGRRRDQSAPGPVRRAVVVADGSASDRGALDAAWPGWSDEVEIVVAADGGARLAEALGFAIDRWVGDGDSLGPSGVVALRAAGVDVRLVPLDKDETDAELALVAALELGATEVVLLGALGGPRIDHALANVALLDHPAVRGRAVALLDPGARIRLLAGPGRLALPGRLGDLVSLIPLEAATGVTTAGLRFPLRDAELAAGPARGVSNIRESAAASVALRTGRILVVEVPATLAR